MFKLNKDLSIYVTRGDYVCFAINEELLAESCEFKAGDVVRITIYGKKNAENVVMQKGFAVKENTNSVEIRLTKDETRIGKSISKPTDYWYEVELNPFTEPRTIIGYDERGAKVFKLFPEGADIESYVPTPRDIPFVDSELDMTSTRPVQNQAVSRELVMLADELKTHKKATTTHAENTDKSLGEIERKLSVEKARIDNIASLKEGSTTGDAELIDGRTDHTGKTWSNIGEHIRGVGRQLYTEINNKSLSEKRVTYTSYAIIQPNEEYLGRIMVGWNKETYPDGMIYEKGTNATYTCRRFDVSENDMIYFSYSSVQNKTANYAVYNESGNLLLIYPTTDIGAESSLQNVEIVMPVNASYLIVSTRTSILPQLYVQKKTATITDAIKESFLQTSFDFVTDAESNALVNEHIVTENSMQVEKLNSRNEYKYPSNIVFGGEYLEHWYEKIYDGTQNVVVDIEGDSISAGYSGQNCFTGMKDLAIKKIMKSGGYDLSKLSIFNNSIGGCSTNDWVGKKQYFKESFRTEANYERYENGMLHYGMERNPDLMVIGFGMNDANIAISELTLKGRLDLFESNFREALQRIRGSEPVNGRDAYNKGVDELSIIITSITNTQGYEERKLKNWHIYANEIMKKLCHEFKCAYVDFTTLTYGYTTDYKNYAQIDNDGKRVGLHPNKYQMAYLMSHLDELVYPVAMHNIDI